MILAAGFGTRLRPLTDSIPKALVPLAGKPLLQLQLEKLENAGFNHIAVNGHYLADQVESFLHSFKSSAHIDYSYEETILNTGGGIKKMLEFFPLQEPIVVMNVDILCTMNYVDLMHFHYKQKADATLVINKRETSRPLLFDKHMQFIGRGTGDPSQQDHAFGFCGIQVIQPELFSTWPEEIFYSIDTYLYAAQHGQKISGYQLGNIYWRDLGNFKDIQEAEIDIKRQNTI